MVVARAPRVPHNACEVLDPAFVTTNSSHLTAAPETVSTLQYLVALRVRPPRPPAASSRYRPAPVVSDPPLPSAWLAPPLSSPPLLRTDDSPRHVSASPSAQTCPHPPFGARLGLDATLPLPAPDVLSPQPDDERNPPTSTPPLYEPLLAPPGPALPPG